MVELVDTEGLSPSALCVQVRVLSGVFDGRSIPGSGEGLMGLRCPLSHQVSSRRSMVRTAILSVAYLGSNPSGSIMNTPKYIVITCPFTHPYPCRKKHFYPTYSKPKLKFTNGGWVEFVNETGNKSSINIDCILSILKVENSPL